LIYHIDERMPNNWEEDHLVVGLMQADGRRDLQSVSPFFRNTGDAADPYPGTTSNRFFGANTKPNSRAYSGTKTGVSLRLLTTASSPIMEAEVRV
jgi:immune inhibitor A